ncbi:MAG: LLM class F420-dependent oxidoreductase [Chloroflexota bacterium]
MNLGLVFPQTEFGNDPIAIRDYAQTAEGLGFSHIVAYDHVLGANPNRPGGWRGPYTHESAFHEPFVLFSFMAAHTTKIQFVPGIIILPQRQTALVAKQAASLDVLSGGRLRLGVGLGWNEVEYVTLNQDFHTRGRRIEEQVALLRQLWTQPLINFTGKWHTIPDAGLKPLPIQRPIPIWFGGTAEGAIKRIARLADGWLLNFRTISDARWALGELDRYLVEAGRSRETFGLEPRLPYGDGRPDAWAAAVAEWKAVGATHLSFNTMGKGFDTPAAHLAAIRQFAEATKDFRSPLRETSEV